MGGFLNRVFCLSHPKQVSYRGPNLVVMVLHLIFYFVFLSKRIQRKPYKERVSHKGQNFDPKTMAFAGSVVSFFAQMTSALIFDALSYIVLVVFSLCTHAVLFYGIRYEVTGAMTPYLAIQVLFSAFVIVLAFDFGQVISTSNPLVVGCFYTDPDYANDGKCKHMEWDTFDIYEQLRNQSGDPDSFPDCTECYPEFRQYSLLVFILLIVVLSSIVVAWNLVLRFVLHLRTKRNRMRREANRVSYFNHGIDFNETGQTGPIPPNPPPVYTEKAQRAEPSVLGVSSLVNSAPAAQATEPTPPYESTPSSEERRPSRTDSLPPYSPHDSTETPIVDGYTPVLEDATHQSGPVHAQSSELQASNSQPQHSVDSIL